jgi:hypothetical protein
MRALLALILALRPLNAAFGEQEGGVQQLTNSIDSIDAMGVVLQKSSAVDRHNLLLKLRQLKENNQASVWREGEEVVLKDNDFVQQMISKIQGIEINVAHQPPITASINAHEQPPKTAPRKRREDEERKRREDEERKRREDEERKKKSKPQSTRTNRWSLQPYPARGRIPGFSQVYCTTSALAPNATRTKRVAIILRSQGFRDWSTQMIASSCCRQSYIAQREIFWSHQVLSAKLQKLGYEADFFGAAYNCTNGRNYASLMPTWYGDQMKSYCLLPFFDGEDKFKLLDHPNGARIAHTGGQGVPFEYGLEMAHSYSTSHGFNYSNLMVFRMDNEIRWNGKTEEEDDAYLQHLLLEERPVNALAFGQQNQDNVLMFSSMYTSTALEIGWNEHETATMIYCAATNRTPTNKDHHRATWSSSCNKDHSDYMGRKFTQSEVRAIAQKVTGNGMKQVFIDDLEGNHQCVRPSKRDLFDIFSKRVCTGTGAPIFRKNPNAVKGGSCSDRYNEYKKFLAAANADDPIQCDYTNDPEEQKSHQDFIRCAPSPQHPGRVFWTNKMKENEERKRREEDERKRREEDEERKRREDEERKKESS